jgi:hypothetical protein
VNTYCDRFSFIPQENCDEKGEGLMEIVDQYDKIGNIYEALGIASPVEHLMYRYY